MDFDQIRAFINVATLRSFSEAGEKMFISQPSVSVRIKALEEEFGVVLFDRSKAREPSLTEAGRIFLDYAQSMINLNDQCREKLSGHRETSTGLIYIGASTVPGIFILPALLTGFRHKFPAVDFDINILDTAAVLENVLNYSFELGFVGLHKEDKRLNYLPLIEDELVFCVRGDMLSNGRYSGNIPLENIFAFHLIMREKGSATRQLLDKKLSEQGYSLNQFQGVTYINSMEGIKQAVKEGLGAAILSKLSVAEMVKTGDIESYAIEGINLCRTLYLVHHRTRILTAATGAFRDYVSDLYR